MLPFNLVWSRSIINIHIHINPIEMVNVLAEIKYFYYCLTLLVCEMLFHCHNSFAGFLLFEKFTQVAWVWCEISWTSKEFTLNTFFFSFWCRLSKTLLCLCLYILWHSHVNWEGLNQVGFLTNVCCQKWWFPFSKLTKDIDWHFF